MEPSTLTFTQHRILTLKALCTKSPLEDNAFILLLEPGDGVVLGDSVADADSSRSDLSAGHSEAGADQDDVEVHTENT